MSTVFLSTGCIMLQLILSWLLVCIVAGNKFDPYIDNGGTVVGLAGKDFVILAADTRLSDQYTIRSRSISRIFEIENGLLFSGSGCWADTLALSKDLKLAAQSYEWEHKAKLRIRPLSYLLSSQLYSRRFFPYYTFCMVAGLDKEGCGSVHRYDAVGSMERVAAVCSGKGEHLIQPLLDEITNMEQDDSLWELSTDGENAFVSSTHRSSPLAVGTGDQENNDGDNISSSAGGTDRDSGGSAVAVKRGHCTDLSCEKACEVVRRAFCAAAEREITVGDGLELWVLKRNNVHSFGTPGTDTNEYILEKQYHALPRH